MVWIMLVLCLKVLPLAEARHKAWHLATVHHIEISEALSQLSLLKEHDQENCRNVGHPHDIDCQVVGEERNRGQTEKSLNVARVSYLAVDTFGEQFAWVVRGKLRQSDEDGKCEIPPALDADIKRDQKEEDSKAQEKTVYFEVALQQWFTEVEDYYHQKEHDRMDNQKGYACAKSPPVVSERVE